MARNTNVFILIAQIMIYNLLIEMLILFLKLQVLFERRIFINNATKSKYLNMIQILNYNNFPKVCNNNWNLMENLRQNQLNQSQKLPSTTSMQMGEILQLATTIQKLQHKNKNIYREIIKKDPFFNYQLYWPKKKKDLSIESRKQLQIQQIDCLLDEQSFLAQKQQQTVLRKQFALQNFLSSKPKKYEGFTFFSLKHILEGSCRKQANNEQRVDNLNKMVMQISGKINEQIRKQKQQAKQNRNSSQNFCVSIQKYSKLEYIYKEIKRQLQMMSVLNHKLVQKIQQKQKMIGQMCKQSEKMESQLQNKVEIIYQKQRRIPQLSCRLKSIQDQLQDAKKFNYIFQNKHELFQLKLSCNGSNPNKSPVKLIIFKKVEEIINFLKSGDDQQAVDNQICQMPILFPSNLVYSSSSIKSDGKRQQSNRDKLDHPIANCIRSQSSINLNSYAYNEKQKNMPEYDSESFLQKKLPKFKRTKTVFKQSLGTYQCPSSWPLRQLDFRQPIKNLCAYTYFKLFKFQNQNKY